MNIHYNRANILQVKIKNQENLPLNTFEVYET